MIIFRFNELIKLEHYMIRGHYPFENYYLKPGYIDDSFYLEEDMNGACIWNTKSEAEAFCRAANKIISSIEKDKKTLPELEIISTQNLLLG